MKERQLATIDAILKRFGSPDETRVLEQGKFGTVTLGGMTIGRATYQPGWKWSEDVGREIGEDYCTVEHVGMAVSGRATAAFSDGRVTEMKARDLFYVPSEPQESWGRWGRALRIAAFPGRNALCEVAE